MLYLDHAATTPLRPEAVDAMQPFLAESFGNPSGWHSISRQAKEALERSRETVASLLGAEHPLDVVFTGGGTEADNLAVAGPALAGSNRRGVVTTAVEHSAVLETTGFLARLGCPVSIVGVDRSGIIDPGAVVAAVADETAVVSVMAANNETGVVQPVGEVARALRDSEVVVHTDAVQFIVSRPASLSELGVDMLTISGHKLGGPKGVGALVMRPGIHLEPVIHGGGQELGRRSGTHDVAGIVGMTAALDAAVRDRMRLADDVAAARDEFEESLKALVPSAVITAHEAERLAQHSHFRIPGIDAETMLVRLDALGVAAAAGSACHSGALEVSHVLTAMGMRPAEARECVRFSFGWTTRRQDGKAAALAVLDALEGLL